MANRVVGVHLSYLHQHDVVITGKKQEQDELKALNCNHPIIMTSMSIMTSMTSYATSNLLNINPTKTADTDMDTEALLITPCNTTH